MEIDATCKCALPSMTGDHWDIFVCRVCSKANFFALGLRTCKKLYDDGSQLLYSNNIFMFEMTNCKTEFSRTSCFRDGWGTRLKLKRVATRAGPLYKPNSKNVPDIEGILEAIASRTLAEELPDYVYFDPFLRFLYAIGPKNAALIKTLKFDGLVKLHKCSIGRCKICSEDMVSSIGLYVPFIRKFCTSVENLILVVNKDPHAAATSKKGKTMALILKEKHEEALALLLEAVKGITSLKDLVVLDGMGHCVKNATGKVKSHWSTVEFSDLDQIVSGTVAFIKKRAKENAQT